MFTDNNVVNIGFTFNYFGNNYTQVIISVHGYVCLHSNKYCEGYRRPSPYDILIGLNIELDPTRVGSGQIYHKNLDLNSLDFTLTKVYLNLFDPEFEPQQMFMITYDNVLPLKPLSTSSASFQIFLSNDFVKSIVIFKFKSCPKDLSYYSSPGLNYKRIDGSLQEVIIAFNQQCIGSNVGQTGVWVIDVTSSGKNFKIKLKYLNRICSAFVRLPPRFYRDVSLEKFGQKYLEKEVKNVFR
jgi:hypothetical protein